ncbi:MULTISPECIES: o-succinylbenzoate synthase [Halomonadaceae]|uniref:o-succinylbenzoate synthase n=1 Tax=Halomonadaceae TaxID=28256 RepID=UPI001599D84E|nr:MULTISPECIES: o-succinylbenzoate synthase [Halomonas]QJQ97186.1 o-succinylbenzoate synthase [Halomonas sp. PA5]
MAAALYSYRLPLIQPMQLQGQWQMEREGLLVRIADGWGEIAPLPGFSGETLAEAEHDVRACLGQLAEDREPTTSLPSVQFGLDCARYCWPRLDTPPSLPYPLLQGTPDEVIQQAAQELSRDTLKAKLKVARYPMEEELRLIARLHARYPSLRLILDANQGWSREEALRFCQRAMVSAIEYLEEPCTSFADTAHVAGASGMPVALDETLAQDKAWRPIPQLKALVLKPMLIGSLARCQALVTQAKVFGLQLVVSSCFESKLGRGQLARLAAQWAPGQAPGLGTAPWLAQDIFDEHGRLDLERLTLLYSSCTEGSSHD